MRIRCALLTLAIMASAGTARAADAPAYSQDVTGFVSAKGERALVMGYPPALEIWAYPLQLASDYRLRFRVAGSVEPVEAAPLLRRVDRTPVEVVRTYVGPDFVVREHLFAPRQQAGVILRYEVEGRPEVQVEARFRPSLDLMWPAALGGQTVQWDAARSGYVLREPLHDFSATISSREAAAHDDPVNRANPVRERLAMLLKPAATGGGPRQATLVFALDRGSADGAAPILRGEAEARADVARHADDVLAQSLEIDTPDAAVNRALASATLALDAAWACSDTLGCGALAGYGPSRPPRRPQYAWFFAGDGLVAMEGMLATGQFARARDELAFVTRYQDPKTGMIWHEMSQSAGLIDWVGAYHYMYVHVDISFQYLAAVQRYVAATGDVDFVRRHWRALQAAWRYCTSVIDRATGLPTIPPGKQGQNEQEDLRDDIRLSTLWIDAADGYAELATLVGRGADAAGARAAAQRARAAIARDGWDDAGGFWLSGHRRDGTPVTSQRPDAIGVLGQRVVSDARAGRVLDRIASPDFTTDWGVRSLSAADPAFDPNLYSAGSVWALGSATVAEAFWRGHRPLNGWAIWRGLAAGDTIDSAGHLHELMAGDLYHPEYESVPEQTWSSAGLLLAATRGMLGLDVQAAARRVTFAPHLPDAWDRVTLRRVRVGADALTLALRRDGDAATLEVNNPGAAVDIDFSPALALGATVRGASVDGNAAASTVASSGQDRHATVRFVAAAGRTTRVRIDTANGVGVAPELALPQLGVRSRNPIVVRAAVTGAALDVDAWVAEAGTSAFLLTTRRVPKATAGATLTPAGAGHYRLVPTGADLDQRRGGYVRRKATITFEE